MQPQGETMKPDTIVNKMREYVQDFREQLTKGDLASVSTLTRNSGAFFRELLREMPPECGAIEPEITVFAGCVERFGTACAHEDLELAAVTLSEMEAATRSAQKACPSKT